MKTYYDLFMVPEDAPIDLIRERYRVLALKFHPDRNPDPKAAEAMKILNEAYDCLKDPQMRAAYDAKIAQLRQPKRQVVQIIIPMSEFGTSGASTTNTTTTGGWSTYGWGFRV